MPTAPKKSTPTPEVIVWNRGRIDGNGHYRAGNWILYHQEKKSDGRPSPVIHPISVGLDVVPRKHWDRALEDAKRVGDSHPMMEAIKSGRLAVVELGKMADAEIFEALDQTANKTLLDAVIQGKTSASTAAVEHAVGIKATWNREDISKVRQITKHFASYTRAA